MDPCCKSDALCELTGWPYNTSHENVLAWSWSGIGDFYLIIVKLIDSAAQALVKVRRTMERRKKR